jgi:hypothetical protein
MSAVRRAWRACKMGERDKKGWGSAIGAALSGCFAPTPTFNSGDTLPFSCFLRSPPPRPAASSRYLFPLCLHTRRSQLPPAPAVGRCLLSSKTHAGRNSAEPSVRRGREWSDRFRHKSSTVVLDYSFGPRPSGLSADQTLSFVWLGESRTDIRSSPPPPHNELPVSRMTA